MANWTDGIFLAFYLERAPVLWDYVDVVRSIFKPADRVLDIGTGGGEIFFSLAPLFREGVGIDQDPAMVETARRNQAARSIANISLKRMDAGDLQFDADVFDVVLLRHSRVYASEIARVLRQAVISSPKWSGNVVH